VKWSFAFGDSTWITPRVSCVWSSVRYWAPDVDPDQGRDGHLLAVHEDVEVRVVVGVDGLLREGRQPERQQAVGEELVLGRPGRLRLADPRKVL
jgi:hypothetical protein